LGPAKARGGDVRPLSWFSLAACAATFVFLPSISKADGRPPCTDIARVDFRNIAINVPEEGLVKLKNGKGYTPPIDQDGKNLGSEWEVTIESDFLLSPQPGVALRLINLNANHLLGSGGWGYALLYACKDGHVRRVFQSIGHLYGVTLKKINETKFTIRYGVYKQHDGLCCPSMQSTDTYAWYSAEGEFKRTKCVIEPWKDEE
jgi:hypothetical protein